VAVHLFLVKNSRSLGSSNSSHPNTTPQSDRLGQYQQVHFKKYHQFSIGKYVGDLEVAVMTFDVVLNPYDCGSTTASEFDSPKGCLNSSQNVLECKTTTLTIRRSHELCLDIPFI
jgi:hypothetical protein